MGGPRALPTSVVSSSPRPLRVLAWFRPALWIVAAAYPLLVYYGITQSLIPKRLLLIVSFAMLLLVIRTTSLSGAARIAQPMMLAGIAVASLLVDTDKVVLVLPVVINILLLIGFWASLHSAMPIVERFARLQASHLGKEEIRYCRSVTVVWCVFFVANATGAALLAAFAPLSWWAWYTGVLSHLLVGSVFAIEYLVRIYRFPHARPLRSPSVPVA